MGVRKLRQSVLAVRGVPDLGRRACEHIAHCIALVAQELGARAMGERRSHIDEGSALDYAELDGRRIATDAHGVRRRSYERWIWPGARHREFGEQPATSWLIRDPSEV
jgi:hypothetical protein